MKARTLFVALARVSSREQEREGFSLDIQVDALNEYAKRNGGEIIRLFRIAETASKKDERKTFKELLAFSKANAHRVSGVLFYKVDRAARNLFDYVELERLESECGIRFISVSQPTENTPAGRMQRRVLASMASFYTEQQSLDVREGLARRVQSGLFVSHAPYGYRNVRIDGRSIIEIDPENAPKIRRIFDLYAYKGKTLDNLGEALVEEGITYCESLARFTRSKLHTILHDRAYIGEVRHKDKWYPGTHTPLVDRTTWDRTQKLLGQKLQRSHEMTYAGELIECGHCGGPITGECKRKATKAGNREYIYYRCSNYNRPGHPRIRLKEAQVESQVFALFDSLRVEDDEFRQTFGTELRKISNGGQDAAVAQAEERQQELAKVRDQQKRLLNLRLMEEIESDTFAAKSQELRDREAELKMLIDFADRDRHEIIDLAVKAFELSQSLRERWVTADFLAKRKMLEIVCLNWKLVDVTLVPTTRKPFDLLIEGPPKKESRGDSQPATYNRGPFDIATLAIFPEYLEFEGQEVLQLVVEGAAGRTAT